MISKCVLLWWLPQPFVDGMNMKFWGQLNDQLLEIVDNTVAVQSHTKSMGSWHLSIDSLEQHPQANVHNDLTAELKMAQGKL